MQITADGYSIERGGGDGARQRFEQIVVEHIDLVYAAALRQVRDPGGAEDVTQRVFMLLAKKFRSLKPGVVMAGWLMNATRFIARDYLRAEARRKKHEQGAAIMQAQQTSVDWQRIEPLLDDALAEIGESNRLAVILKYLQGKSAVEVGTILGISEEAARKRVSRGLEELRNIFRTRGMELSAEGIGTLLGVFAVKPAPAGLTIHTTATVSGRSAGGILKAAKIKMAASIFAAIIVGGAIVGGVRIFRPHLARVAVALPSAPPAAADMLTGSVFDMQGRPVAGAKIVVATPQDRLTFPGPVGWGPRRQLPAVPITDAAGRYSVPQPAPPYALFVIDDRGFGQADWQQLANVPDLILRPWAKVEGTLRAGPVPLPREHIILWKADERGDPWGNLFEVWGETITDAEGHYAFPRVPPGELWLYHQQWGDPQVSSQYRYAQVQAGQTLQVNLGGTGRAVVGKIVAPASLAGLIEWKMHDVHSYDTYLTRLDAPGREYAPKHEAGETEEQFTATQLAFGKTEAGRLRNEWEFGSDFAVQPDGTFRIDDLPAGKYHITIRNFEEQKAEHFNEEIAECEISFQIPVGASPDMKPVDIGRLALKPIQRNTRPGEPAPDFVTKTIDGKEWRLTDQRGKVVVLMFWTTGHTSDFFAELSRRWGNDSHVALLGICVAFDGQKLDIATVQKLAAEHGMSCPQTLDGRRLGTLYQNGPTAILIGRDGRIVLKNLDRDVLIEAVNAQVNK